MEQEDHMKVQSQYLDKFTTLINNSMKKSIIIIAFVIGVVGFAAAQSSYPGVTQKYRYLPYFSPAMAGMNDNLDINFGYNNQPSGLSNSLTGTFFSGYFSTGAAHSTRNSIRGTQSVDDYYSRRKNLSLRFGFGTAVLSEQIGNYTKTYNSNTFAVHVPVAEHTYLSMGVALGFNIANLDVTELTVRDPSDPVYQAYLADGDNSSFHIDAGIAILSDDFYLAVGLNNLTNVYVSGNELATQKVMVANFMGGYRVFHSNDVEIIAVSMVNTQQDLDAAWNIGVRGKFRQILMAGFNYTGQKAFITQLGVQINDYINLGYSLSYNTNPALVVTSAHEIGVGLRFFNHNKYVPIW